MRPAPTFLRVPPAQGGAPARREPRAAPELAGAPSTSAGHIPGEAGIWIFILGDMLVFGAFFAAFLVQRAAERDTFATSRGALTVAVGAANTLVLLTSSLFVAVAVRAHRSDDRARARRFVSLAGLCALAFATIKISEWANELGAGHTPGDNLFFTYYYLLTGLHFLHLAIGSGVLLFWWRLLDRPPREEGERRVVECCASYWHLVDLLWVVVFPVLYLTAT